CDIGAFEADNFQQTGPTFTVNNTSDADDGTCTLTDCSLREAINAANSNAGTDTIVFDIPDTYLALIYPGSALPEITDPVVIDGFAGYDYVVLDGSETETAVSGLTISAGNSTVRGISIQNFGEHGILLTTGGGNSITDNNISYNSGDGIRVLDGTENTLLSNSIYENGGLGIDLNGDGPTPNDANDPDTGANTLLNTPVIIRTVPDMYDILVEGRLNAAPNTTYTLEFFDNYSCDASGYGEGEYFIGSDEVTTNAAGNVEFSITLYAGGGEEGEGQDYLLDQEEMSTSFITATATDEAGNTSEFSQCDLASPGNDAWTRALEIPLVSDSVSPEVFTGAVSQYIDKQDQSRWFKFQVQPDSSLIVTLTNLPANYDLTVYKDISETFNDLLTADDTSDLLELTAEFAPDAFSPDAFSPDAFSPDAFSPDAFSPDAFSPDAFSADIFSPDAFSPDAFSPDAFSPDAFSPDAFSPDAFSPDAFSPDAFSPDAFSPDAFSPDAFSSAQTRSLLAVSAYNGTAGEGVMLNTWENEGTYYVRVRGRNGAFSLASPFDLDVTMTTGNCSSVSSTLPASDLVPTAGGFNTLILVDNSRLVDTTGAIGTRLATLAERAEVNGVIVDLGSDARVAAANAQADNFPTCPFAKNLVAYATKDIVDSYRALNPIEYIVIVGNDDVIPFFRHPDQALLANERNYVPPMRDNTASQASLKLGYILSQDRYGASLELSSRSGSLPIATIPVGRLVETSANITAQLDAYLATSDGVVTPQSSLVTGYDFLEDAANAVASELTAGIGSNATTLITPHDISPTDPTSWTADQLRAELLNNRFDISFLAGHFSAGSALAADYSTRLLASEVVASSVDMTNMLIFSAGCHSGYNSVNAHGVANVTLEPDWAQAFAQKGATLIAGTGYQYGDTDFIEYSERLYLDFSEQLRMGTGPVSIGNALVAAKQNYLAETPELRPLHEKS
ncbi:MAG: right-handed parallel beta-helix repeat-containing protein, partial [Anaerolineales bacterium]|nr:right-handed parallel beta-helix repeat-containing protein [Anaerolineales bacterium]